MDTGATHTGLAGGCECHGGERNIFISLVQEDRGALALVNGIVYVPYSGYFGDCGELSWLGSWRAHQQSFEWWHGWATTATGGGIWGHSGVASDGTNMFVITGTRLNTGGNWRGGEAIIRLQAGPILSGQPPITGRRQIGSVLDNSDTDLGGFSAMLIDVPGANPSQLVLALGKDGNAYLLNRNNLGGITAPVTQLSVDGSSGASHLPLTPRAREHILFFVRQQRD